MTQLDSILKGIDSLSESDKAEILARLLQRSYSDADAEEAAVGRRGLNYWSSSTKNEDWAPYYPDELRGTGGLAG